MLSGLVLGAIAQLSVVHAETSIPKPSVPEFTVKLVDTSYDEPATYSIDPFTGEQVTRAGSHVERVSLEVRIKNQPFVPDKEADGMSFFYNIRVKGRFSQDWIELCRASDGYPTQSDSEYTVIYLGTLSQDGLSLGSGTVALNIPLGGQADFQVEALNGYISREYDGSNAGPFSFPWTFTGEKSGWSRTQTITIDDDSSGTTPNNLSPQNPIAPTDQSGTNTMITQLGLDLTEIITYATLGIVFVSLVTVIAFMHRKIKRLKRQNENISTTGAGE